MENKKLVTILVLTTTVILAGIALFTAVKLYQLGQEPANPSTKPKAKVTNASAQVPLVAEGDTNGICEKVIELAQASISPSPSPSESPSPSPSQSPSPSPSASVSPECWDTCSSSSDCPNSLICQNISGTYRCVNSSCTTESDCICASSPSPSPSASVAPECWDTCSSSNDCPSSLLCQNISGTYRCVNASCPTESDCICTTTVSPSPGASVVTVATQQLPVAGSVSPTLIFSIGGTLLLLLGILL